MGLFDLFKRKEVDAEGARRALLLRTRRIGAAGALDVPITDASEITHVFYTYRANGRQYE